MPFITIHPFKSLKKIFPASLYGRSLLIIIMPLLLLLISMGYVFYDRHTQTILRQLSMTFAGNIAVVGDLIDQGNLQKKTLSQIGAKLNFELTLLPHKQLVPEKQSSEDWLYSFMDTALKEKLGHPYFIYITEDHITVYVVLHHDLLKVTFLKKRLFSRTTPIVFIWTLVTALLLFLIASVFMKNQIRPIRKLADAADQFGRGIDVERFKPEGAEEVRRAGIAFTIMRERIRRHLTERVEMLAGVSHDLRTPLSRMKLQLAMMEPSEDIELLKEDVVQMQKMLQGFLDFSRGAGQEDPVYIFVLPLLDSIKRTLADPEFQITIRCSPDLEWLLKEDLFKRCLTNLLVNSKRYATCADIVVHKTATTLVITIDDNGPGIPVDQREKVFLPFYRLDEARNVNEGGVGLGLSIVKDAVRSHGGQVTLGDVPNHQGLRVIIRLPQ